MKRNDYAPLNIVEKINARVSLLCAAAVLTGLVLLFCRLDHLLVQVPAEEAKKQLEAEEQEKAAPQKKPPVVTTASVIAAGDNYYQSSVLMFGQDGSGVWNYDKVYDHIRGEIQAADLAIVTQETVLTKSHYSVSASDYYSTPTEVGDALVNAGFDVVCSATEHVDDWGADFLNETLDFWSTSHPETLVAGIHASEQDAGTVSIIEVNGIRIAILDYTYSTNTGNASNGTFTPNTGGRNYMVDILSRRKDAVASMIQSAGEQADCIIFVAHWGTVDEPMPNEYEKQWASFLMEQGVDVLIGSHPHVLQPYGVMNDLEDESGMTVFYSLGNFVSSSDNWIERLGGLASFTITKTVSEEEGTVVEITDPAVKPIVMHTDDDSGDYGPYLLEDYTRSLAAKCSIRNSVGELFSLTNLYRKFEEIMSMNVTPSSDTSLLDARFSYDGTLLDADGNRMTMLSTTEAGYYNALGIDISDYSYFQDIDYTGGSGTRSDGAPSDGTPPDEEQSDEEPADETL